MEIHDNIKIFYILEKNSLKNSEKILIFIFNILFMIILYVMFFLLNK